MTNRELEKRIALTLYHTYRVPSMRTSTSDHSSFLHLPGAEVEIYNNPYRNLVVAVNLNTFETDDPLNLILSELDKISLERYPAEISKLVSSLETYNDKVAFRRAIVEESEWRVSTLESEYPRIRSLWEKAMSDDEYRLILIDALSDLPSIFPAVHVQPESGAYTPFGSMFE